MLKVTANALRQQVQTYVELELLIDWNLLLSQENVPIICEFFIIKIENMPIICEFLVLDNESRGASIGKGNQRRFRRVFSRKRKERKTFDGPTSHVGRGTK